MVGTSVCVCVTGGKSVKLSLPECSKSTVDSGHDVCVSLCVFPVNVCGVLSLARVL